MTGIGDYLNRRAKDLGMERRDVLRAVQKRLDDLYPGQARAVSLNEGVLKISTPSAAVASELRLKQTEFEHGKDVKRVRISIS